jgi:ABC-type transporter Mla maintaining outer membrane lipid asymmetry ATPase subunit MlaF
MTARSRQHAEPILSARGIVNRFGKQVVHDKLNLDILRGEIIGIAGGSGSGKSVLLKTLVGLHRPNAGKVLVDGEAIQKIRPAKKPRSSASCSSKAHCFRGLRCRRTSCCRCANIRICPLRSRRRSRQ